eukprot:5609005-Karenia_brevis.AAC.1
MMIAGEGSATAGRLLEALAELQCTISQGLGKRLQEASGELMQKITAVADAQAGALRNEIRQTADTIKTLANKTFTLDVVTWVEADNVKATDVETLVEVDNVKLASKTFTSDVETLVEDDNAKATSMT